MRGKLVDDSLKVAPSNLTIEKEDGTSTIYIGASDDLLAENGWKEVINTPMPSNATVNHHYVSHYEEDDTTITLVWELEEDDASVIIGKLKTWFDTNYREYFEKLTRFAALGINESINDLFRRKKYHSLNDLYLEAERVRQEINYLENENE